MSAALAFEAAERAGVSIAVQYGRIHLKAKAAPPATVLDLIKLHREEILAILTAEADAKPARRTQTGVSRTQTGVLRTQNTDANDAHVDTWAAWNERAAIMEFEARLCRRSAERKAAELLLRGVR